MDRSYKCHNTRDEMSELTSMSRHSNDNIPRKRLQQDVVLILSHVRNKGVFNKTPCSVLSHARIDPIRMLSQQELLNGDLAAKTGRGIFSKDLMDRECNCSIPYKVNRKYFPAQFLRQGLR